MRRIERQATFRRDFKRVKQSGQYKHFEQLIVDALSLLASDAQLPTRYRDHPLAGNFSSFRECHVKPDLLLIYAKPDERSLVLVRLGSHSDLFG